LLDRRDTHITENRHRNPPKNLVCMCEFSGKKEPLSNTIL
jgi:hypothetical protein